MQRGTLLAMSWAVILLVGCSSQPTGGSTPAGSIPESEFVDRMVAVYCEGLGACCQNQGLAFDAALCDAGAPQLFGPRGSFCEPGSTYDIQAAGACFEESKSYVSSCGTLGVRWPAACNRICVGTLPVGAACREHEQCAPTSSGPALCDLSVSMDDGVCAPVVRGRLGDTCAASCEGSECFWHSRLVPGGETVPGNDVCYAEDGLYCGNWTCEALEEVGATCGVDTCVRSAYCTMAGVCEAKQPAGASCTRPDECLGACDRATGLCVGENGFAATTELCAGNFGISSVPAG